MEFSIYLEELAEALILSLEFFEDSFTLLTVSIELLLSGEEHRALPLYYRPKLSILEAQLIVFGRQLRQLARYEVLLLEHFTLEDHGLA